MQHAEEGEREGDGGRALIGEVQTTASTVHELRGVGDHAARKDEAVGVELAGEKETLSVVGRETEALFFVKDGVGESGEALERGEEAGGECGGGRERDDKLGSAKGVESLWIQIAGDAGREEVEGDFIGLELEGLRGVGRVGGVDGRGDGRWRRGPGEGGDEVVAGEAGQAGEVRPLVGKGGEGVVEKDVVVVVAGAFLEGSAMRLPKPPEGSVSWLGKKRS